MKHTFFSGPPISTVRPRPTIEGPFRDQRGLDLFIGRCVAIAMVTGIIWICVKLWQWLA